MEQLEKKTRYCLLIYSAGHWSKYIIYCALYCSAIAWGLVNVDNYFACAKVHGFFVSRFFEIIQPFAGSEEM